MQQPDKPISRVLYDPTLNAVVLDLAPHPDEVYAVIVRGKLLPMRFASYDQAHGHMRAMQHPRDKRPEEAAA